VRRFEEKAEVPLLHALTLNTHDQVVPCIELLLSAGAEVDKLCLDEDGDTCTALMWATNSLYGEPHMRALLAHGAKLSVQNSSGQTALHTAASVGFLDRCEMLLAVDKRMLNVASKEGHHTAAMAAASCGHAAVLQALHKHGADLTLRSSDGYTALHLAAAFKESSVPVLQYLLDTGEIDINTLSTAGATPLQLAVQAGNTDSVKFLLERGAGI
jgi:ankyrin repeat protein